MLKAERILPEDDFLSIRIGWGRDLQAEGIVLLGRTVWRAPDGDECHRYGVAFLRGQWDSHEKLRRFREMDQAKAMATTLRLMFVDLSPSMVERRALTYINRDLAFSLNCIPLKLRGERLMVAMAEPDDSRTLQKLQLFSQCNVVPVVATRSAIKNTLIQCWGTAYVSSGAERPGTFSLGATRQRRKPALLVFVSNTPNLSGKCLAANFAAVLNRDDKRAVLADLSSGSPVVEDDVPGGSAGNGEWLFLTVPMGTDRSCLDWAVRADEAVLVVSPSHWQQGCYYLEAVFDRFVEIQRRQWVSSQGARDQRQVLEFSVVCAHVSDMQQGFKIFNLMEKKVHDELDMREPRVDIRMFYIGGILEDEKNLRKAEKAGLPLTRVKPLSPASQCMNHIAQSLVKPTPQRDPRFRLNPSLVSRIFG
jgi:hypothetical protein